MPGYEAELVNDDGDTVARCELGKLVVKGQLSAEGYWNQRARSQRTFVGEWTYAGDKYYLDDDGYYRFCGRTNSMLKSGGNWVPPSEVEAILIAHPTVLEVPSSGIQMNTVTLNPKRSSC